MSIEAETKATTMMPGRQQIDGESEFHMASLLWMACIALLLVPMATLVDIPIARWFSHHPLPRVLGDALDLSLVYAHGSGIALILVSLMLLSPRNRWNVPRLATLALGGSAVSTLTKMFILRPRPNSLNLDSAGNDYAWIWSFDWKLEHVANFDAGTRAFPSAYLATATALTFGLWVVLPRGRWLFVTLCAAILVQRLYCGAHFLSDLFGSAAVGLWWSFVCFHPKLMGNLFDKMEPERRPRRRRWEEPHTPLVQHPSTIESPMPRPAINASSQAASPNQLSPDHLSVDDQAGKHSPLANTVSDSHVEESNPVPSAATNRDADAKDQMEPIRKAA